MEQSRETWQTTIYCPIIGEWVENLNPLAVQKKAEKNMRKFFADWEEQCGPLDDELHELLEASVKESHGVDHRMGIMFLEDMFYRFMREKTGHDIRLRKAYDRSNT